MPKHIRLVDLIANELDTMGYHQRKAFKAELQDRLPGFIEETARTVKSEPVKPDTETLSVKQE
jgi:hypothetical protein